MTVIVALKRADGGVCMAADKRVTLKRGWRIPAADPKIAFVGEMLVGVCGSNAPGELLLSWTAPKREPDSDALEYLRRRVGPAFRQWVAKHGLQDEDWGALIALDGRLFEMDEAAGVTEVNGSFWAVGSGKAIALGFLTGLCRGRQRALGYDGICASLKDLEQAVEIASLYDTTCGDGVDSLFTGPRP